MERLKPSVTGKIPMNGQQGVLKQDRMRNQKFQTKKRLKQYSGTWKNYSSDVKPGKDKYEMEKTRDMT